MPPSQVDCLLNPARAGSTEALGQILNTCRQYLLLVANRELDSDLQAKVGPSDVVQDTLLEAQKDFGRFHGTTQGEVFAWVRRILLHNIANLREHYRGTRKRDISREVPLADFLDSSAADGLVDQTPSPSKQVLARESHEELRRAVAQLPQQYQEALRLRHQENCSFEEIGRHMGRSAEAARKLWARAVEQLKQLLGSSHDSTG
jgi:RNA polymerase sigma-70 factor (ECF subfamily)